MSIIYLLSAIYMYYNNITPSQYFFIEWALFSIADATWANRGNKGKTYRCAEKEV